MQTLRKSDQHANPGHAFLERAFHLAALRASRLHWVDYLKGIAIILVVYRHMLIGMRNGAMVIPPYLEQANLVFFSFRMPLFFILSGIFIGRSLQRKTWGQVVLQKFDNLFYPYLIWAFLQLSLEIAMSRLGYSNAAHTPHDYWYILYQPRNIDQFWYLPALFNCTLVYTFVKAKLRAPVALQLALGVGLYFLSPYVASVSMLGDWMGFYIFFALGDALAKTFFQPSVQALLRNPLSLVIMAPFFIVSQVIFLTRPTNDLEFLGIALIGCATMFIVAFLLEKWNVLSFLRLVGYHSLYIYVLHVIVASMTRILLTHFFHIHEVHVVLLTGICLGVTLPIVFYNLCVRNRPLWFLFSFRRNKTTATRTDPPALPQEQPVAYGLTH